MYNVIELMCDFFGILFGQLFQALTTTNNKMIFQAFKVSRN